MNLPVSVIGDAVIVAVICSVSLKHTERVEEAILREQKIVLQ
jgi:hypothetical protein